MASQKLGCEVQEMDGEQDHVHLLIAYPPKLSISLIVNNLKATASRRLRELNPELKMISKNGALWSRAYFACSVGGAPIEVLKQYIEQQETPK
ncbi:hypothetical protein CI610_03156 [invertebrate metagenome]|uniref:Transposase IS200-like domain-containing protein n=1 Tax=invertebrate metagenome TaxID=1711999 RepID=A0A2H9T3Y2_9ZZZZ